MATIVDHIEAPAESNQQEKLDTVSPRNSGRGPWILSIAAFCLSLMAFVFTIFFDPIGSRLTSYDFSTPEAAMRSEIQAEEDQHFRTMMRMRWQRTRRKRLEKLESLKVHETVPFDRAQDAKAWKRDSAYHDFNPVVKVLFISYEVNGDTRFDVEYMHKFKETGEWYSTYMSSYEVRRDKQLAKKIRDWRAKDKSDSGPGETTAKTRDASR